MNQVETFNTVQILDINNITALYLLARNVLLRGSFVNTRNSNNSVSLKIGGDSYSLNKDRVDKLELIVQSWLIPFFIRNSDLFKLLTEISKGLDYLSNLAYTSFYDIEEENHQLPA